ncbi:hypothetical protein V8F20_011155 [Naviculisporaceae sp. PSN 640]
MRITVSELVTCACLLAASAEAGPLRGTRWLRDVPFSNSSSSSGGSSSTRSSPQSIDRNADFATRSPEAGPEAPASTLSTLPDSLFESTTTIAQGSSNVGNSEATPSSTQVASTSTLSIPAPTLRSSLALPLESSTSLSTSTESGFSFSPPALSSPSTTVLTFTPPQGPAASGTEPGSAVTSGLSTGLSTSTDEAPSSSFTGTNVVNSPIPSESSISTTFATSSLLSSVVSNITTSAPPSATSSLQVTSFISDGSIIPPPSQTTTKRLNSTSTTSSTSGNPTSLPIFSPSAEPFPNVTSTIASSSTTRQFLNSTLSTITRSSTTKTLQPTGTPNPEIPTGVATSIPPTGTVDAITLRKNVQQAIDLNHMYTEQTPDSACKPKQVACVAGGTGICTDDGVWRIYPCEQAGTSCIAVPMGVSDGVKLNCLDKQTAVEILGQNATLFFPPPSISTSLDPVSDTSTTSQTGKYTKTLSVTTALETKTVVTATDTVTVDPEPSAPPSESNTVEPISSAPAPSATGAPSQAVPSNSDEGAGDPTATHTVTVVRSTTTQVVTYTFRPTIILPDTTTSAPAVPETSTLKEPETPTPAETKTSEPANLSSILGPSPVVGPVTVTVVSVSVSTATATVTATEMQTTTMTQTQTQTQQAPAVTVTVPAGLGGDTGRADKSPPPTSEEQNSIVPVETSSSTFR